MTDPEDIYYFADSVGDEVEILETKAKEILISHTGCAVLLTRPDLEAMHRAIGDYLERTKPNG